MINKVVFAAAAGMMLAASAVPAAAQVDHVPAMKKYVEENLKQLMSDPAVIAAVKAQNEKTAGYSQAKIDELDQQWRSEVGSGGGPLVEETLKAKLSGHLTEVKNAQQGMITELFVMDAKGLNVGQSDPTSDYWQGDEAKWQKTFGAGAGAVFVDEVEQDESTQMLQSQASFTIVDPETGAPIGAVTAGVNLEMLEL